MNTGYLYLIKDDEFQCREIRFGGDYPEGSVLPCLFPDGVWYISTTPNVVYNGTIWLTNRDDRLAIDMFLYYNTLELDAAVKKFNLTVAILNEGVK